jgi:hypothetical protein
MEWRFLKEVMLKMGFTPKWVELIMMCVSSASFAVMLNGTPTGSIVPSRGIRPGDPILP